MKLKEDALARPSGADLDLPTVLVKMNDKLSRNIHEMN
jgi:hypothetical protein